MNITVVGRYIPGTSGDDVQQGGSWDDMIDGSAGRDVINGGDGFDTVDYGTSTAAINVDLAATVQHGGYAEGDTLTGVEAVRGSAFADTIRGNSADNTLSGGDGADSIFGGEGADIISGGIDGKIDVLDGGSGPWHDTVTYADVIRGGMIVTLGEGAEAGSTWTRDMVTYATLPGGTTIPIITMGHQEDVLFGFEDVIGSQAADIITGNSGANALKGGAGNDSLTGAGGADILTGGTGADTFIYKALSDSTVAAHDTIQDFELGIDKIDLSAIDGNRGLPGFQPFHFSGTAFDGTSGSFVVTPAHWSTVLPGDLAQVTLMGDVNGDKIADFRIDVTVQTTSLAFDLSHDLIGVPHDVII